MANNNTNQTYQLIIRFNDDSADLQIPTTDFKSLSTVALKKTIRDSKPALSNKNLKLIYSGRILNNLTNFETDVLRLSKLTNNSDDVVKVYIHCLIGDDLTEQELNDEQSASPAAQAAQQNQQQQQQQSTAPAPVGFDRLLSQGFSRQDIADLRRQFQSIYGTGAGHSEDLRTLEERWIDSTVNNEIDEFQNLTSSAVNDTNFELLIGIIIGSLLGLLALFLLKLDFLGLSKRSKMAIVAGVIVNFSFAVVRAWT